MKILLTPFTLPVFSTVLGFSLLTNLPAHAASIASFWNFNFTGDITGSGSIELDADDFDSTTGSFLVTNMDFTLNFGVGSDPQSISLINFPGTQPLRFNPNDNNNELYSTFLGSLLTEWRLGTVPNVGNFNLSGSPGIGLPPDPDGVGGVIDFTPFDSTVATTGTWTAQSSTVREPSTLFGLGLAALLILTSSPSKSKIQLDHKHLG